MRARSLEATQTSTLNGMRANGLEPSLDQADISYEAADNKERS